MVGLVLEVPRHRPSKDPPLRPPFVSFVDSTSIWRAESSGSQPIYRKLFSHGPHSSKNNFFEIKISQTRDWETPSLFYYSSWCDILYQLICRGKTTDLSSEPATWSCYKCQRMFDLDSCQSNHTNTAG